MQNHDTVTSYNAHETKEVTYDEHVEMENANAEHQTRRGPQVLANFNINLSTEQKEDLEKIVAQVDQPIAVIVSSALGFFLDLVRCGDIVADKKGFHWVQEMWAPNAADAPRDMGQD